MYVYMCVYEVVNQVKSTRGFIDFYYLALCKNMLWWLENVKSAKDDKMLIKKSNILAQGKLCP